MEPYDAFFVELGQSFVKGLVRSLNEIIALVIILVIMVWLYLKFM